MGRVSISYGFKTAVWIFVVCVWCVCVREGAAKGRFDESQVKSVFLYNLTHFTTWPEAAFPTPESPFIITIAGKDPFGSNLDQIIAHETVGTHPIVVRRVHATKDILPSHMVYLDPRLARELTNDLDGLSRSGSAFGLLTVSDAERFAHRGGCVNLLVKNNRLMLELNVLAAEKNGLKFSSKLLRLATIVD